MKDFKFSESEARGFKWDFKVDELTLMGYIGQVVAWMRLTWLQEPEGGFDGLGYWAKKVLLFDSGPEAWYVQYATGVCKIIANCELKTVGLLSKSSATKARICSRCSQRELMQIQKVKSTSWPRRLLGGC
jgi:hypothetical protein